MGCGISTGADLADDQSTFTLVLRCVLCLACASSNGRVMDIIFEYLLFMMRTGILTCRIMRPMT